LRSSMSSWWGASGALDSGGGVAGASDGGSGLSGGGGLATAGLGVAGAGDSGSGASGAGGLAPEGAAAPGGPGEPAAPSGSAGPGAPDGNGGALGTPGRPGRPGAPGASGAGADAGPDVSHTEGAGGGRRDDYRGLCIHTVTTKPWPIETAIERYARAGIGGITVWRDALTERSAEATGRRIRDAGLEVVSLCRGGFFPSVDRDERERALEENRAAVQEAAALGAPLVVLVCGADPRQPLAQSRKQIVEGIEALAPFAARCGVKLGIEPLHPMYADTRSAIVTLRQAREACEAVAAANVGVVVDVYHIWWDPDLELELGKLGADRIFAYHICDWRVPTEHMLTDRGIMGEGCIPLRQIDRRIRRVGFAGFEEVEIFSTRLWNQDQDEVLGRILAAWEPAVAG